MPFRVMVCGDEPALSINVMVALAAPNFDGTNRTPTLQVKPGARLPPSPPPHVFDVTNSVAFTPPSVMVLK